MDSWFKKRRVVVTGAAVMSAAGKDLPTFWQSLVAGKSSIQDLTLIDTQRQTCKIAGEIRDFDPEAFMDKKVARRMDRYTQLAFSAARKAYQDSGLVMGDVVPERFGIAVGTGAGGFTTIEKQLASMQARGQCSPFTVPMMLCNMATGNLAIEFNAQGPSCTTVTACSTGTDSIGNAFRMIQNDEVDVMLAGASEAPITYLSFAGFTAARSLSLNNIDPNKASRPFDKDRDGFVMAEGAAILTLESLEHALARGARIYGEICGYGRSMDASDLVRPPTDGKGLALAMKSALRDANLESEQIAYINAHATSTVAGDIAETNAIKTIFGKKALDQTLLISSTKSMTGHLLGASGALEAVIALLALRERIAPPTINLENPDPACDLNYVAHHAQPIQNCRYVMSNSAGFGGHNASLIFGELN
jgi:3-oxoacyl-[acyl-carrier-protein] synthase II